MAPGAKLAFIDIGFDNGALSLPSDSRLLGTGRNPNGEGPMAHIHSASWGVIGENGYNYQSRSFDSYMYSNDDFLILVAAGNDGRYDAKNTVSAPSTAKNIISVGASHSFANDLDAGMLGPAHVADFSSRGPSADGRIKVRSSVRKVNEKPTLLSSFLLIDCSFLVNFRSTFTKPDLGKSASAVQEGHAMLFSYNIHVVLELFLLTNK